MCTSSNVRWKGKARLGHSQAQRATFEILDLKPKAVLVHTPRSSSQCPINWLIHWSDAIFRHPLKHLQVFLPTTGWAVCAVGGGREEWVLMTVALSPAADLFARGGKTLKREVEEGEYSEKGIRSGPDIPLNTRTITSCL